MAYGEFDPTGGATASSSTPTTSTPYTPPKGGLFGLHLPKLGLGDLLNMPGEIASGLIGAVEHPSRLPMMVRGAGAATFGSFARLGNALTLHKLDVPNAEINQTAGGIFGAGTSATEKQQLGGLAAGQWSKGAIPGLIGDIGSFAIPAQGAHALAALGDVGEAANAGLTASRAAEAGVSDASIAEKAAKIADLTPAERALSRVPILNRLRQAAADVHGGSGVLNAAARAAARVGNKAESAVEASRLGEVSGDLDPAVVAQRARILDILHAGGHPYQTLGQRVLQPIGQAAIANIGNKASELADTVTEAPTDAGRHFKPIQLRDMTAEAAPTSRSVSDVEFQSIAQRGADALDRMTTAGSAPEALDSNWDGIVNHAFEKAQQSWGGATYDAHTGEEITPTKGLAVSIKTEGQNTISVPEHATPEQFRAAMDQARQEFGPQLEMNGGHLGVFHDDGMHEIQIDPIAMVDTKAQAEELSAASHSLGGAYDYATGNGHFAPHVADDIAAHTTLNNEVGTDASEVAAPEQNPPSIDSARTGGPAEARLVNSLNKPIPEWATKLVSKSPEVAKAIAANLEQHFIDHEVKAVAREFTRNIEVARNQTLRSDAMTSARAAAQDLVDRGIVSSPAQAETMVFNHLTRALDGQTFLAHAVGQGATPEFQQYLTEAMGQTDDIPAEAIASSEELAQHLNDAAAQWKGLRDEAKAGLLAGRPGAKGLEKSIHPPEVTMTPSQTKRYRQIIKQYQRATGMMPMVDKEAEAARKSIMANEDRMATLGAKAENYTDQSRAEAEKVLDQTAPKSLATPEARAAVADDIINRTNTESHAMFSPSSGKRVVFAKFADAADRADGSVIVTPSTGKPGTYERFAVAIDTTDVPQEQWVADPHTVMQQFMQDHAAALAHPDVKIATSVSGDGTVHISLTQSSIDGRYLTMGQAHVLGQARGVQTVTDMVHNDWHPVTDSDSMLHAAKHVPEIMRPRSQFNRYLRESETSLDTLTALAAKDGVEARITADDMRNQMQMFMRFADAQGREASLDKFYGRLGIEARRSAQFVPEEALLQTYLNMTPDLGTIKAAAKYLGPETDKALRWYNDQHATIEGQFRGKPINLVDAAGTVRSVDMADLMYSLLAVTSVNASPLSNVATAMRGLASLVDYQKSAGWLDTFSRGMKQYAQDYDASAFKRDEAGNVVKTLGLSKSSPVTANELFDKLVGGEGKAAKLPHLTSVRADVMQILSGHLLDDWTNEYVQQHYGRTFRDMGSDQATMEHYGSNAYAKIRSFHENLAHPETSQGVTLDRVMSELFGVAGGDWNTKGRYGEFADKVRQLADQWSVAKYGETGKILPHQVQAMLWVYAKAVGNDIDRGRFVNDIADTLDSIDQGTFSEKDNPMGASIRSDVEFAKASPAGINERTIKIRPGVKQGVNPAGKLPKATDFKTHEQWQKAQIDKRAAELVPAYSSNGSPKNWAARAREIQAKLDRGDIAGAKADVLAYSKTQMKRFRNDAEGFDVFGPGRQTAATQAVLDKLRNDGIIGPAEGAMFQEAPEVEAMRELRGIATAKPTDFNVANDALKGLAESQPVAGSDAFFQKYGDDSVLGATYTSNKTGRLTMAFFKTADATTLVHEGAHVLRQFLNDDEIATLERTLGGKVGERDFEEKFADTFTSYLNHTPAGEKYAGLAPMFDRVKEALATIWQGVQGRAVDNIDPNVASIIDRYLAPDTGSLGDAPKLPEFKVELAGKTSEQIAANLPKRQGETQAQSLRRGYLAGKAATREAWLDEKARTAVQTKAVLAKANTDLSKAITEHTLPRAQAMDRLLTKTARQADKLATEMDNPSSAQIPPEWQPMWQAWRQLQAAAVDDPQIARQLAGMPQTFGEVVDYATAHGFEPTHVSSLSESDIKRLVRAPAQLGSRGRIATAVESGTRKARFSANYRTRTLEALAAAQVDVVWERETNNLIDVIEHSVAKPYVKGTPGWVAWDDQRGFLVTGEHTARPEPTLMVPEAVAKGIRTMSGDFKHPIFDALGHSKIIRAWKAYVMTLAPQHYVNVALNQMTLAATQGVTLHDYVTALVNMRTGESGNFVRAAKWLEAHGKGGLPESVDINQLRGIGANSEFAESTDGLRSSAMRELVRPAAAEGVRSAVSGAEGVGGKFSAGSDASKVKLAHAMDRANAFNASLHRLSRAAVYVAGRRQGLSDLEAMNRSYEALVDYGNLSPMERAVMTTVFPFYGFQKGLLKIMARFPIDHPVRASLAMQIAALNQTLNGPELPAYYQQLAHLPGTNLMASTKPVDPFQDALALGSPEGIAQSMNPALQMVFGQAFNGSNGYVTNWKIDQFGNTVPDTSPAQDLSGIVSSGPEGSLLGSVAGLGTGGGGRGAGRGVAAFGGLKTYSPAQIAKLQKRLSSSVSHTGGGFHQAWEADAKPKPVTTSIS